jgi:ribosomal protein S12 methylthiotransferase accessory factor
VGSVSTLNRVESLVSPYGVVAHVSRRRGPRGLAEFGAWLALLGSGSCDHRGLSKARSARPVRASGLDPADPDRGRLIAIAEAAERYAAGDFLGEPVRVARADELDGAVIDLASVPRCSASELAADGCPLSAPDPGATVRWVRGVDLATAEPIWLPAVMACYRLPDLRSGERFWLRISTGYAVHTDPVEAIIRGVCEVIERDAIAVTWLQRLPLPLIGPKAQSGLIDEVLSRCGRHFVQTYLFDATSDMGVPTVYCLQIAQYDTSMRQAVSCATGRTTVAAAEKALMEAVRYRVPGLERREVPQDFRDFSGVTDGAAYMGRPEMSAAFDFLTEGAPHRLAPPRVPLPAEPVQALAAITDTLEAAGMRAIAVDRTTRELAAVGLTAVCVLVPDLQPMSLHPLAQYRAHRRLYDAPLRMGYRSLEEEELNPWPQPFA